jgi:hypothetical protein
MSAARNQAMRAKKKIQKAIAKMSPDQVEALRKELEGNG